MHLDTPYLLFLGAATDLLSVKIANAVVDWRPGLAVGELALPGCTVTKGLDRLTLAEAQERGARTLVIALNNAGGYVDTQWIPVIIGALDAGLDVASGLHMKLGDIPEIRAKAMHNGRRLIDVRHCGEKLATGTGARRTGRRLLTVGTDCSVGKMYTTLAVEKEMRSRDIDADFVATGQCGIMVSGQGIAIDCVVADFISGAVEQMASDNDAGHWDLIEGQGSLFHPAFAGVSLGLLHGAQPDALVLCHAEGRPTMRGLPSYPVIDPGDAMDRNLEAARLTNVDARFVGIAVNTSGLPADDSRAVLKRYEDRFGLPCVDPMRSGVATIVDYVTLSAEQ